MRSGRETRSLVIFGIIVHFIYVTMQIVVLWRKPFPLIEKLEGVVIMFVYLAMLVFRMDFKADYGPMILLNMILAGESEKSGKSLAKTGTIYWVTQ